jgi:predicted negative regulator of RcsB-dependent stress response
VLGLDRQRDRKFQKIFMANHLDLEEQEQIDQLKHFWKQYGNLITWCLIAVLGVFSSWNAYQYWQRSQSTQASAIFDELERAVKSSDNTKIERAFADLKDGFASTAYAQQAGLLAAKYFSETGKTDAAIAALSWVADKSSDPGYQSIAKLRLAGMKMEAKAFDDAAKLLSGSFPASFEALVADRKGDTYLAQGKKAEATAEYKKAFSGFDERTEYRRLVEVKLNSLGVDAQASLSQSKSSSPAGEGNK